MDEQRLDHTIRRRHSGVSLCLLKDEENQTEIHRFQAN